MDLLDRMLGHDQWATGRMLEYCRDLTDAQLDQEFDIGIRTLRGTLDHLIANVNFWTAMMAGEPEPGERDRQPSIAELIARHERFSAAFAAVARRARDDGRLDDTFVDHAGYPQSLGGTIVHVAYHNAQHRADAKHILERLGVPDVWDLDPQEWEHVTGRS